MRPFGERRYNARLEPRAAVFWALATEGRRYCAQNGVVTKASGSGKSEMELTSV